MTNNGNSTDSSPEKAVRKRNWLTFSLRTFLIVTTLAAVGIWQFVVWWQGSEPPEDTLPGGLVWNQPRRGFPNQYDAHGPFSLLDRHGRTLARGKFLEGKATGRWTHYHATGGTALSGECVDGVPAKVWKAWDEHWRKRVEVTYDARYLPADPLHPSYHYEAKTVSARSGPIRLWWSNGRRKAEGNMREDMREGVWAFWDEAGHKTAEGEFRSGVRQGEWKLYDPATAQSRVVWFLQGQEISDREEVVARLTRDLKSPDRKTRFAAVEALGKLGSPAAPALAGALSSNETPLVLRALVALVELNADAKAAIPALRGMIATAKADSEVRREGLIARFLLDDSDRASVFRELLLCATTTDLEEFRHWNARLAMLGPEVLTALDKTLEDANPAVRLGSVHVLAHLRQSAEFFGLEQERQVKRGEFERLLTKVKSDEDPRIRQPVREMLDREKMLSPTFYPTRKTRSSPGLTNIIPVVG